MPLKSNFLKPMSGINAMILSRFPLIRVRKQYMQLVTNINNQLFEEELDLDPELMTCVTMQCPPSAGLPCKKQL